LCGRANLGIAVAEPARPTRQRPRMLVSCMMEGIDVENWFEGIEDLVDLTRRIDRKLIRIWRWRLMLER
jgi:hypothetical protein